MNIGFKTLSGDKLIIGVLSDRANGFQIRRIMAELAEIKQSFETFFNGRSFYASPKRLMKRVTKLDGSDLFLYEFNSCGFLSFIKINSRSHDNLSTFATVFDTIIFLTSTEMTLQESYEYKPTQVITVNLADEARDQAELSFNLDEHENDEDIDVGARSFGSYCLMS